MLLLHETRKYFIEELHLQKYIVDFTINISMHKFDHCEMKAYPKICQDVIFILSIFILSLLHQDGTLVFTKWLQSLMTH